MSGLSWNKSYLIGFLLDNMLDFLVFIFMQIILVCILNIINIKLWRFYILLIFMMSIPPFVLSCNTLAGLNIKLFFLSSNSGLTLIFCLCLSSFDIIPFMLGSGISQRCGLMDLGILTLAFPLLDSTIVSRHGSPSFNFLDYLTRKIMVFFSTSVATTLCTTQTTALNLRMKSIKAVTYFLQLHTSPLLRIYSLPDLCASVDIQVPSGNCFLYYMSR